MLGRFLELSVPAPEILDAWHYYQRLGFTSAAAGETWSHPYAVATDGRVAIGLHGAELDEPTLSYVLPGLRGHIAALEGAGADFDRLALSDDSFHLAEFVGPAGLHLRILEARTFSPADRIAPSALGWFEEVSLPVADLDAARLAWERLGFVAVTSGEDPWPHVSLTSDTLNIGLHETRELAVPTLLFSNDDMPALRARLAELGVQPARRSPRSLDPATHLQLVAPEGTHLLVGPPTS